MTAKSTYLMQLMSRLHYAGVNGSDIGDLVAELSGHLDETDADPVEEFGPVHSLAPSVIEQRRVRRLTWLRRLGLPWLGLVLAAVGITALFAEGTDGGALLSLRVLVYTTMFLVAVFAGILVMVRRRQGADWVPSPVGTATTVIVLIAGSLLAGLVDPGTGITVTSRTRWYILGVALALLTMALLTARNPIRFPNGFDSDGMELGPAFRRLSRLRS